MAGAWLDAMKIDRGSLRAACGALLLAVLPQAGATETNLWPVLVRQEDSAHGRPDQTSHLGPFIARTERDSTRILSLRPLWTSFHNMETGETSAHILYPLLNWGDRGNDQSGHGLNLVQYRHDAVRDDTFFQVFPFLFSRQAAEPEHSYFALWPVGGVLKNRFGRDRITFAAWPLFVRTERRGDEVRVHVPYPFVQTLRGPHSRGFGLWPLFGRFERDGHYQHTWALWPVGYHYRDRMERGVPYVRFGLWPLFHRETADGLFSASFVWPFFGYTREAEPRPVYSENRYFWPFLVQGRGEEKHVNRWLPVYANETRPGQAKRWYLWPLLKRENFTEPGLDRDRTTLLFFVYRDEQQRFAGTTARLAFLWPLAGYWDDGFGHRQLQLLDPLSVFFPSNQKIKENWSPLFAVYRLDERAGNRRHSLLWDLLVWERDADGLSAFYLGPLVEWVRDSHWGVLRGLRDGEAPAQPRARRPGHFRRR